MMEKIFFLSFMLFILFSAPNAQSFEQEIKAFAVEDSVNGIPKNCILFIGSSSFTNWKDVQSYFPHTKILNRAFGGSTLLDIFFWKEQVIFSYKPKQIVLYCGENDIAYQDTIQPSTVLQRFKQLYFSIKNTLPQVNLVYVSIKPSPARWKLKMKMTETNFLIQQFLKRKPNTKFVNIWHGMLQSHNKPNGKLFIADSLHMNANGYKLWQKKLQLYLIN